MLARLNRVFCQAVGISLVFLCQFAHAAEDASKRWYFSNNSDGWLAGIFYGPDSDTPDVVFDCAKADAKIVHFSTGLETAKAAIGTSITISIKTDTDSWPERVRLTESEEGNYWVGTIQKPHQFLEAFRTARVISLIMPRGAPIRLTDSGRSSAIRQLTAVCATQ